MAELGYRYKRRERRRRIAAISAAAVLLFVFGFGLGRVTKQTTIQAIEGETPVPCLTLAVIPSDYLPKPGDFMINVLNGSKRIGMAGITAEILEVRGFRINEIGNFSEYVVTAPAEIHYGPKGKDRAQLLAAYVDGAKLVLDDREGAKVDFVIGQQFDDLRTDNQVKAELKRPIASPSGPGC